jgi:hypothetical protein
MEVPHERLKPETLRAVIEEFVTREGTDYGDGDFTLEQKVAQVMTQLKQGKVVLSVDEETGTCHVTVRGS